MRRIRTVTGHAVVIVGDLIPERLAQARSFGCETVDLRTDAPLPDMITQILGEPEVDAAIDCVGFEARGHGSDAGEAPATALNDVMTITQAAGKVGIPGLYVAGDAGASTRTPRLVSSTFALAWAGQSHSLSSQANAL